MLPKPWPDLSVTPERFRKPPREYGILPFWFLNGELAPDEMRYQLGELRAHGMSGVILHGRYGLEMPYLGPEYLERIRLAVGEAHRLGLKTWIYDEMNWPSGTADGRVLRAQPGLAQRYLECISFTVRGPWFTYLTGADSRYLDFERSTPVAAFAMTQEGDDGTRIIDLTPNLSFVNVIPWEAPPGNWRLMYILEKRADYYIDAPNPEATAAFLQQGYEPYAQAVSEGMSAQMQGFYTDEPAMHYYLSGADNAVVPWTQDMFRRFQSRYGYNLRPRLPDLFFDVSADSPRVRHDFYSALTEFYSDAYYRQIHEWCRAHDVLFTGHLLYEEGLRRLIRVEGNPFRHYEHFDVLGVDHLYPYVGSRDRPDEHVALKLASSAAHQLGSPRLLCESFGGIFMDATMQRMKWIADWEYVLGVNLLNPHGFHYTLEGPRKRDWPPSQFYQYPWWHYYEQFSGYMSRLSHLLSGGRHVAHVAVLWPMSAMFATYTPQAHNALADRCEADFNALTDLLLRLHYDFDYLDEDVLAGAELEGGQIRVRDEAYSLLILPPMAFLKLGTVERLERLAASGGRLLGMVYLPDRAFSEAGLVDIAERVAALFGVDPRQSQARFRERTEASIAWQDQDGGGRAAFLETYALSRQLPLRLQRQLGQPGRPESGAFVIEAGGEVGNSGSRYFVNLPDGDRQEVTAEVTEDRAEIAGKLAEALAGLLPADVAIGNPEIFYLHRIKDGRDIYFFANPTLAEQSGEVTLSGEAQPLLWDPSTGEQRPIVPARATGGRTHFRLTLPLAGSAFVLTEDRLPWQVLETNLVVDSLQDGRLAGHTGEDEGYLVLAGDGGQTRRLKAGLAGAAGSGTPSLLVLDGDWEFVAEDPNALVIGHWQAAAETPGAAPERYTEQGAGQGVEWLPMVPGAWSYQLPAEPDRPYPLAVWYRIQFEADYRPEQLELIVDGFAGSEWELYINGLRLSQPAQRSRIDSQMQSVNIARLVQLGENSLVLRLTLTSATDGLLDLLKLMGDFSVARRTDGSYALAAPCRRLAPAAWTAQGYPFFSGRALYRRRFTWQLAGHDRRVYLEADAGDDVLEVVVNGRPAGVRLWPPYAVDVTDLLQAGENLVELRVANTLVNLLEAVHRPSGLRAAPRLISYNQFSFELPQQ